MKNQFAQDAKSIEDLGFASSSSIPGKLKTSFFTLPIFLVLLLNVLILNIETAIALQKEPESIHLQLEKAQTDVQDQHYRRAYYHFHKLARGGHAPSQHISGLMNEKGCGTPKNLRKAVGYYKLAAEHDFADSQSKLGHMYLEGNAVLRKDYAKAKLWLEKAANNNVPEAQHSLGMMYANGQGVRPDLDKAEHWLKAASSNGVKAAATAVEKLPPVPMPGRPAGGGNALGSAGESYDSDLQSIQQSWSGYGDVVQDLNRIHP